MIQLGQQVHPQVFFPPCCGTWSKSRVWVVFVWENGQGMVWKGLGLTGGTARVKRIRKIWKNGEGRLRQREGMISGENSEYGGVVDVFLMQCNVQCSSLHSLFIEAPKQRITQVASINNTNKDQNDAKTASLHALLSLCLAFNKRQSFLSC